jgi:hypothetical protein
MALKIHTMVFTALMVFALLPCIVITASAVKTVIRTGYFLVYAEGESGIYKLSD